MSSSPAAKRSPWLCRSPEKGYRVRQRAPAMTLAPGLTAQPASLPSLPGWPVAARGPRCPVLRAPALWARAVAGLRRGPRAALLAGKRTLASSAGFAGSTGSGERAATPPGRAAVQSPALGGGRGSGGGDPGAAGSRDNFPGLPRLGTLE